VVAARRYEPPAPRRAGSISRMVSRFEPDCVHGSHRRPLVDSDPVARFGIDPRPRLRTELPVVARRDSDLLRESRRRALQDSDPHRHAPERERASDRLRVSPEMVADRDANCVCSVRRSHDVALDPFERWWEASSGRNRAWWRRRGRRLVNRLERDSVPAGHALLRQSALGSAPRRQSASSSCSAHTHRHAAHMVARRPESALRGRALLRSVGECSRAH